MKKFILSLLFLTSCATVPVYKTVENIPVGVAFSTVYTDLNDRESERILHRLDYYCGGLWCRGGWVYHFERGGRFNCKYGERSCLLSAKVYTSTMHSTFRSCRIKGPSRYRDIIVGDKLDPRFLQQVVECIELWEDAGFRKSE